MRRLAMTDPEPAKDDVATLLALVERIVRECPARKPTSADELRAQQIVAEEFARLGVPTSWHRFEFNDNLYANLALHFGLGVLGTAVSGLAPAAGLALHLLSGTSFWLDSTRRAYLLRRLFRFKPSQNLLATLPAEGRPELRIVLAAHADAAFTGLLFDERVVRSVVGRRLPGVLERALALATHTQFALAGFDALRLVFGPLTLPLRPIELVLTLPSLVVLAANLEILLRNQVVPGANDDLTGVAALPALAARLARDKPASVELVFVATGCEEASMGGADALARDKRWEWDRTRTVFLALDMLTNGELRYIDVEGDVSPAPIPDWLAATIRETAASQPRFSQVSPFRPPVGGTDAAAFLAHGFAAASLICVDPALGVPRHYHLPSDTPENLDAGQLSLSLDFAEALVRAIWRRRVPGAG